MRFIRRFAVTVLPLALPLAALAGCSHSPRDRLQGTWSGEGVENLPPGQLAKASGWARGVRFEFKAGKVTVRIPTESPRSGSFKIARVEGDRVTVAFTREEGGHDEAEFSFVGEKGLRWHLGDGRDVVLTKVEN